MAYDVTSLFDPRQNWGLTDITVGLIGSDRIAQSARNQPHRTNPDLLEVNFLFDSKSPPILGGRLGQLVGFGANLNGIFASEFQYRVEKRNVGFYVRPEKVGPVHPLKEALERLDCPYYLQGGFVTLRRPSSGIVATIYLADLHNYISMQEARYRELRLKLGDKETER